MTKMIAVSFTEYQQYGCINCGCEFCFAGGLRMGNCTPVCCGECQTHFVILADGLTESPMAFSNENGEHYHPPLSPHPRQGTLKHEYVREDKKPESGGEYFYTRGIGVDDTPGCIICGGPSGYHHNIAAFVESKAAGERIVKMFSTGARLDYRPNEPSRIQVKIGACDDHQEKLEDLCSLTMEGTITQDMVDEILKTQE